MTAHWGIPDPAAVEGTPEEIARAFRDAFVILDRRIGLFLALPLATLQQFAIQYQHRVPGSIESEVAASKGGILQEFVSLTPIGHQRLLELLAVRQRGVLPEENG